VQGLVFERPIVHKVTMVFRDARRARLARPAVAADRAAGPFAPPQRASQRPVAEGLVISREGQPHPIPQLGEPVGERPEMIAVGLAPAVEPFQRKLMRGLPIFASRRGSRAPYLLRGRAATLLCGP
jgi:hypothetical protein